MYSFTVVGSNISTKKFPNLSEGVPIADKITRKGRMIGLWVLARLYKIPVGFLRSPTIKFSKFKMYLSERLSFWKNNPFCKEW